MFKCEKKMLWLMKLLDFVVWNFFLMILNEQIIQCIIKFGMFVKILKDTTKGRNESSFSISA